MKIGLFDYELPTRLIAQKPTDPRSACKLMVIDRRTQEISHHVFSELVDILDKNTVLVINDTKVFPARLFGKKSTGGATEILLLTRTGSDTFSAIGKGSLRQGSKISFAGLTAKIISRSPTAEMELRFDQSGPDLLDTIDRIGHTPLPPYIYSKEKESLLRRQYQTVYAKYTGSAAAPTAGLHFTLEMLDKLRNKGVKIEKVTLHVGLGTFKPVTNEQIRSKVLHTEKYFLDRATADRLNNDKKQGKKVIAIGTTTCRVLETCAGSKGVLHAGEGETDIFIQPGYKFKFIDGLITNFHLPKTSLLMLVSALISLPNSPTPFSDFRTSLIGRAYEQAIKNSYKFFSFGDATLIL